jgi:hypothetical protein
MAKVYNELGGLSDLIQVINDKKINSLKDIIDFKKNFDERKKETFEINKIRLNNEISVIRNKVKKIENENLGILRQFFKEIEIIFLLRKISKLEDNFDFIIEKRVAEDIYKLEHIDRIIVKNRDSIYGAVGELKVIKELKKLPDSFYVINNYKKNFPDPIYNRKEDDRIYSVQIDHLVVGPTGMFIIETKNWSEKTIKRKDLFSPVKQVERAGFALFVWLNSAAKNGKIKTLMSNWGARKITPQKVIILINGSYIEKFQYVEIVPIDKIFSYITTRRRENFSEEEIEDVAKYLLNEKVRL